eukprot:Colp12_sorted_trinity150504_noHs@24772
MIFGIGVDIVQVSRIERVVRLRGAKFLKRIYHPSELLQYQAKVSQFGHSHPKVFQFLASRWAVKEATYKAAQPYWLSWKDIALQSKDSTSKPQLSIDGELKAMFLKENLTMAHVSLSHDGDYAIAKVILEK